MVSSSGATVRTTRVRTGANWPRCARTSCRKRLTRFSTTRRDFRAEPAKSAENERHGHGSRRQRVADSAPVAERFALLPAAGRRATGYWHASLCQRGAAVSNLRQPIIIVDNLIERRTSWCRELHHISESMRLRSGTYRRRPSAFSCRAEGDGPVCVGRQLCSRLITIS